MVDEGEWCDCEHELIFITEVCNQLSWDGFLHVLEACLHEVVLAGEEFKVLVIECFLAVELSGAPISNNGEHAWVGWCWMVWHCWHWLIGVGFHKGINDFLLCGCPLFWCHQDPCPAGVFCAWVDAGKAAEVGFDSFLEFLDLCSGGMRAYHVLGWFGLKGVPE